MILLTTQDVIRKHVIMRGTFFGARGGSCSCDPCDCNPCRCGDAVTPNTPLWRVSGCVIDEGMVGETNLAHLVLLSLAQPREEGENAEWEEILLVDSSVTREQLAALLAIFEEELESLPTEIGPLPRYQRAVYRVPLAYTPDEKRPLLRVGLTPDQTVQVRASEKYGQSYPRARIYDGPMAVREHF